MNNFNLDHLNPVEFENFCFELLNSIGFINLNWRKGTGFNISPSDSGRDIQGNILIKEIDEKTFLQKWFIECKHYKKGVPPSELSNAITWANAERPDVLLIIASNFLSNGTKDYINDYIINNKPSFRIKYWEAPDLEKLSSDKDILLNKYKIINSLLKFNHINPTHLLYISTLNLNTLDYFFSILDSIDSKIRDGLFSHTYFTIINPRFKNPKTGKEKMGELLIDEISYDVFKNKCYEISKILSDSFLINSIISYTLQFSYHQSDKSRIKEVINNHEYLIKELEDDISRNKLKIDKEEAIIMIQDSKRMIKEIPDLFEESYQKYIYLCKNIVAELFKEKLIFKLPKLPDLSII